MALGVWVWVWAFAGAKVFQVWVSVGVSGARIAQVAFGEGGGKLAVVVAVAEVEGVAGLVVEERGRVHLQRVWQGFVELEDH